MNINTKLAKIGTKTLLKLKKISPELMIGGGIVLGVACVVTACMATKKVDGIIEQTHEELNLVQSDIEKNNNIDISDPELFNKELKKAYFKVYMSTGLRFVKLYGPSAFMGIGSVGLILASHGILKTRYLSTAAAYTALDEAFKDYRKRISNIAGEESEKRFFNGTEETSIDILDDENGESKKIKAVKANSRKYTPYEFDWNRFTAPTCWETNAERNLYFLKAQKQYCDDLLNSRGHLFLNEVLDAIGLDRTPEGAVTGWLRGTGDDIVDFGIEEFYTDDYCDDSKYIKNLHLHFNVDGLIWNKI